MTSPPALWTIVLAAGEGTRLRPLTRLLHDEELPKQFAMIQPGQSLLQSTIERTLQFCPAERTIVVVAEDRADIARSQLHRYGSIEVVVQPRNLGTGPGILLPLMHVAARDPDAVVAIVPSDHFVKDSQPFAETVRTAVQAAQRENALILIGAVPDHAETEYGWIVPSGGASESSSAVLRFHEKPHGHLAGRLLRSGGLWNTFLMVGSVEQLQLLAEKHLPEHSREFAAYRAALAAASGARLLAAMYARMTSADFSRDVLENAAGLRVIPLRPCGWSDWGTPRRVLSSLRGSADFAALVDLIRAKTQRDPSAGFAELVEL